MEERKNARKARYAEDSKVTACSLAIIVLQSIIIILGMYYRWDWLAYECAAMLIIPAIIILYHGIMAVVRANALMVQERKIADGEGHGKN